MSGVIRQRIGPVKATLLRHLQQLPNITVPQLEPDVPVEDTLTQLIELQQQLTFEITRIQRSVTLLNEKDAEWGQIMQNTPPGEAQMREEEFHRTAAEGPNGYVAAMTRGQEVLDVLIARLREVE